MARKRSWDVVLHADYVTIGELVELSGIRYSTIKYYTEEGMLPFKQEDTRLTRRYPRVTALERLAMIKELREAGLTIKEIKRKLSEETT